MGNNYRIRTDFGSDKNIRININQNFDFLEILSLKLKQDDVYTRFCADYGVVAGRVIVNGGYGVPNANVSIFIPLSEQDENDVVISTLYPYKRVDQKNEDGYRYNLLPYRPEYGGHTPTGTFPDREDLLTRQEVLEVYEKYYKFTAKTNESGDFMIVGVPLGIQTIVMDLDLSNIGCFSLRPADLIRAGLAGPGQFNGNQFKSSTDLDSLPQIVNFKKDIDVSSFWGEEELCNIGITRVDFDLRELGIEIKPQAVFMGSILSTSNEDFLKTTCKPKKDVGNLCDLVTGEGKILAIRQTIGYDSTGRPVLEQFNLENGGDVIDENGTWLVEVPMNLDYVITNEFGEQVISNDPSIGIPTKGKYRFRIQYQNEAGMENDIMRGDYLVPNIKEWGWTSSNINGPDTFTAAQLDAQKKSYAFSLDWNDYGDLTTTLGQQMVQDAINCEDKFYEFTFNKVYTIANFVDRWKWGFNRSRHLGIKEITDRRCTTTNNRFPVNDGVRNFDFIFFLFNLFVTILTPVFVALIPILHLLALLWPILKWVLVFVIPGLLGFFAFSAFQDAYTSAVSIAPAFGFIAWSIVKGIIYLTAAGVFIAKVAPLLVAFKFKGINLPMMSYPDCEACPCDSPDLDTPDVTGGIFSSGSQTQGSIGPYTIYNRPNNSILADLNSNDFWSRIPNTTICAVDGDGEQIYQDGCPNWFCKIKPNEYGGTNTQEANKAAADSVGVRYGIAGFQTGVLKGVPITEVFSNSGNDRYIFNKNITLSQSLNMANLRARYFETTAPNRITTTINNGIPFTDSVLVLLVDNQVINQYQTGSIVSFYNPSNINDINLVSGNTNSFGTNAITGSVTTATTIQLTYTNPSNGSVVGPININITGETLEKEYKFKTGIEYFQVITGITASNANIFANGNNTIDQCSPTLDQTNLIRKYILNKLQVVGYDPPGPGGTNVEDEIINPLTIVGEGWKDLGLIFLTRGVDVYTDTQDIKYDLSLLFGRPQGTIVVSGKYNMNIPLQPNNDSSTYKWDYKTPQTHSLSYSQSGVFYEPYNFVTSDFSSVTTTQLRYYSSLDKSNVTTFKPDNGPGVGFLSTYISQANGTSLINNTIKFNLVGTIQDQGRVDGGSLIASSYASTGTAPNNRFFGSNQINNGSMNARVYAPTYSNTLSHTIPTGVNPKLVLRSDRLPTSDSTQTNNNNSFSLHQNDNFTIYVVGISNSTANPSEGNTASDSTNNSGDFSGDTPSVQDSVLSTFSCEGMVPLKCYDYDSNGEFIVKSPCDDNDPQVVQGGCYKFVQKPYLVGIGKDIKNFAEWKSRFRMMFGACRGVFSHVFQNNWVNGTLYMFSFKKKTIFNFVGQPKKYKFCGTLDNSFRPGQGPIYYTEGTTNSLFYRSSPYDGTNFIGQEPRKKDLSGNWQSAGFKGMNDKNLFFPTTIMDMGSRDEFVREICFNPALEAYFVDEVKSTSFNETADILQLFFVSRLVSSNFLQNLIGAGDASINKLFSRSEDRMDGDIVQMFSINSEFGIEPFSEDEYDQPSDLYVAGGTGADPLMGIFFQSNRELRALASPGALVFSPTLVSNFGYPNSQEVPMYKWKAATTTTIFGNDQNDWVTSANQNNAGNGFFSENYQDLSFVQSPYSPYFNNGPTGGQGYIYQQNGQESPWPASQSDKFIVGAPYHFYFGLNVGKSAINRYITKYILNTNG
jgi:hypothetical protein